MTVIALLKLKAFWDVHAALTLLNNKELKAIKLDRLMGILTILLKNEKVTAPYLAGMFEVSKRTILRDLDALSMAGIPVMTFQGNSGGITLDSSYKMDNRLLTEEDLQGIMVGLSGLDSITTGSKYKAIANKFEGKCSNIGVDSTLKIDLASHYKDSIAPKIEEIQTAIKGKKQLSFDYVYNKGEERKIIEPYWIIYKWSAWYVFGYAVDRCDFRYYKLNRLWNPKIEPLAFELRPVTEEKAEIENFYKDSLHLVAYFQPSVKYRIVEAYGLECFCCAEDGRLKFERSFTDKAFLLEWLLSFGGLVEVLQPTYLQDELIHHAQNILNLYLKRDT